MQDYIRAYAYTYCRDDDDDAITARRPRWSRQSAQRNRGQRKLARTCIGYSEAQVPAAIAIEEDDCSI